MADVATFGLFLTTALVLAVTPGPGIFYVLTRSLKGGRREGVSSSLGTAVGGLVHVALAALGLSAILMTSATAFTIIKIAGAAYLVYLGVRTLLARDDRHLDNLEDSGGIGRNRDALYQGIVVEALNPKTALFFLAFLPQFVNSQGSVGLQLLVLGSICVFLNTTADLVVAAFAGPIGRRMRDSIRFRRGQRLFTGSALIGLGAYVAVAGDKR